MALRLLITSSIIRALQEVKLMKNRQGSRSIKCLLMAQLSISLLLALILFFFSGEKKAISALLGGLVAIAPSYLFAKKLFRYDGAKFARQIVKSLYWGETLKLVTTIGLFAFIFKWIQINPEVFLLTYTIIVVSHWLAPLFFNKHSE